MGSASRVALTAAKAAVAKASGKSVAAGAAILAVGRAIGETPALRAALANPVADAKAKAALVDGVVGKVDATASSLLHVIVVERWSSADEMLAGIEAALDDFPNLRAVGVTREPVRSVLSYLRKNVIVARTFSKVYGLAGLRLGYSVAAEKTTKLLRAWQLEDNGNMIALHAGLAALPSYRSALDAEGFAERRADPIDLPLGHREAELGKQNFSSHGVVASFLAPQAFLQGTVMFQKRLDLKTTLNRVTVDLVKMF